jgi:hypothetical protein
MIHMIHMILHSCVIVWLTGLAGYAATVEAELG